MNHPMPYSCSTSAADRNRFLDGDAHESLRDYLDHLIDCSSCRSRHRAAVRMIESLSDTPSVKPSPDLAARIFAAVQADRVRPASRRDVPSRRFAFAVAASLFLCTLLGLGWFLQPSRVTVSEGVARAPKSEPVAIASATPVKLKDRLSSAGSAFLARTQKATSETIPNIPLSNALTSRTVRPPVETFATIDQVGSGATSTLTPIADSTRRMIDLFRRELPTVDPNLKPNS